MTLDESLQVEELLLGWHRWQDAYRPALSGPRCDPTCRNYRSGDARLTDKEQAELADTKIWMANSEKVEVCVETLTWQHRASIQMSMANKRIGRDVFSNPRIPKEEAHRLYQEAKELLFPKFFARGLIKPPIVEKNIEEVL
ncbi:hypothetical protein G3N58_17690 [Paraburkholderia sp. Ac-20342]|uniref:hypothetical protein n=1 Tax=Paraburkholderia sp. Ac-20342 TaxID=2703889 RepID=UPI00197F9154|nr:hypothetical protein [Paraburkholderia sp. Ac-20342]MBN3848641.1 hypothetical protein [Paraburkholderia sp. Ac-20342]